MTDGVPRIADAPTDHVCAGCCMGKMREDNFSRSPEKTAKSAGVLDLIHSDVMGPMQTKTPGGCTYTVTFIDDFSRHVPVYFMKKKAEVLEKFKMFKADMEYATGRKIKRIRSDNDGEYTGRLFKEYLSKQGKDSAAHASA
ncbi:hypothetical protein PR003_g17831 [Phytophthora rubi]|uniref:Integrase catalytic domain-containing protein n=1 Tax=Phytophthora rubi TaxID=129364 RepID=A0A6A3JNH0_9STRA|nr:hypothetical protein PR002_g19253 [Phytophthora rubi]KAE9320015.1 hypothetical protein PR003_g17831 [Phytophthora rubi]